MFPEQKFKRFLGLGHMYIDLVMIRMLDDPLTVKCSMSDGLLTNEIAPRSVKSVRLTADDSTPISRSPIHTFPHFFCSLQARSFAPPPACSLVCSLSPPGKRKETSAASARGLVYFRRCHWQHRVYSFTHLAELDRLV